MGPTRIKLGSKNKIVLVPSEPINSLGSGEFSGEKTSSCENSVFFFRFLNICAVLELLEFSGTEQL
jgi:hypothetical protein